MTDENIDLPAPDSPPEPAPPVPALSADIMRATKPGLWLSLVLIAFAAALLAFFQWFVFPLIGTTLGAAPPLHTITTIKGIFIAMIALGILCAVAIIRSGAQSLRSGRYPPPGAWVWRDTRIRQGRAAAFFAWSCISFGVLAGILCIGAGVYAWKKFDRSMPHPSLSVSMPGVPAPQGKPATTVK